MKTNDHFVSEHWVYGQTRKVRSTDNPTVFDHDDSENPDQWHTTDESDFDYGEWVGVIDTHKQLEKYAKKLAGKFVASNGIVVVPQAAGGGNAVNFYKVPTNRESQTVPNVVLDAYQEYLARPTYEEFEGYWIGIKPNYTDRDYYVAWEIGDEKAGTEAGGLVGEFNSKEAWEGVASFARNEDDRQFIAPGVALAHYLESKGL